MTQDPWYPPQPAPATPLALRLLVIALFLGPFLLPVVAVLGAAAVVLLILGGGATLVVLFLAAIVQAITGGGRGRYDHIDAR